MPYSACKCRPHGGKGYGIPPELTDDQRLKPESWEAYTLDQKITILKDLIKEIKYDGGTAILEIILNSTQKSHKFNVSKAELKYHTITPKDRLIQSEPQLRQNLLLAHQIQELIEKNKTKDIKEVSGWLNLSQQRMNQVMSFSSSRLAFRKRSFFKMIHAYLKSRSINCGLSPMSLTGTSSTRCGRNSPK